MRLKTLCLCSLLFILPALPGNAASMNPNPACAEAISHLKVGMSRAEFDKWAVRDNGIFEPFKRERFVVRCPGLMVPNDSNLRFDAAFKPAGMTDEVYTLGKWVATEPDPADTLMSMSELYTGFAPPQASGAGPVISMEQAVQFAKAYADAHGMRMENAYLKEAYFHSYTMMNSFPGHPGARDDETNGRSWEITWQVPATNGGVIKGGTTKIYVFENGTYRVAHGE